MPGSLMPDNRPKRAKIKRARSRIDATLRYGVFLENSPTPSISSWSNNTLDPFASPFSPFIDVGRNVRREIVVLGVHRSYIALDLVEPRGQSTKSRDIILSVALRCLKAGMSYGCYSISMCDH